MKKYKTIDLFTGAGGLTKGFVDNNFEIVESVEFWEPAVNTYNFNFHTVTFPSDITSDELRSRIEKKHKNKVDLVIGGFPCQGYSMAGKRSVDDPRNQLYKYTIDIIGRIKPKFFVLENVKGILSFKEKDGVKVMDKIESLLKEKGYYSKYILVDASKFGVPQKRERVIFIGAKEKDFKKVDKCISLIEKHTEPIVTTYDAIHDLENIPENIEWNHIFSKHTEAMIGKIKNTKQGESLMKSFSDAFRRIYYDKPSPTVKENHGGVHIHPVKNRVLTPRELARLQSFPDDFIFQGNKSQILKQIGNAVPPKLAFEIAKIVKSVFYGE